MSTQAPPWFSALAPEVRLLGASALLAERPVALVGSRRCPGAILLAAADWADEWVSRAAQRPVLAGGFQTPVEQEVLRRLIRGGAPVVVFPARRLPRRLPPDQKAAVDGGTLTFASPFTNARATLAVAQARNNLLRTQTRAAIVLYADPGSQTMAWVMSMIDKGVPVSVLDHDANGELIAAGARPFTFETGYEPFHS